MLLAVALVISYLMKGEATLQKEVCAQVRRKQTKEGHQYA
jgi:hypothetical protein